MSYRISIFVILVALFAADDALAQRDFLPTDTEWYQWPEYCRVRYGGDRAGQNSKFHSMITPAQTAALKASIGEQAYYYLHHHCYGVGHYFRAQAATTPQVRSHELQRALSESGEALMRTPKTNRMYAEIATFLTRVQWDANQKDAAFDLAESIIKEQPKNERGYLVKARLQRQTGKLQDAVATLTEGNTQTEGKSAEIHYFLGLFYVALDDFPHAIEHAQQAYALGHPLPGLRNQLQAAGHPLPPAPPAATPQEPAADTPQPPAAQTPQQQE
jgi:hypothetical protein